MKSRKLTDSMIQSAEDFAQADRSDPFTRDRVLSHYRSGVAKPGDYSVRFRRETTTVIGYGGRPIDKTVHVPFDMKCL